MLRRVIGRSWICAAAVVFSSLPAVHAEEAVSKEYLAFSAGIFDVGGDDAAAALRGEYWSDFELLRLGSLSALRPFGGVMATSNSSSFAYAGLLMDIPVGPAILTLSFAPGIYHQGDGRDLGHSLEFRSQAELAYRFDSGARLGVAVSHMSNAGIGNRNPGAESVVLTYAYPLARLLAD